MSELGSPREPRELVGRLVRQVWVEWAREQADPKPSWLLPWEDLDDGQREVDMRIGAALFEAGQQSPTDSGGGWNRGPFIAQGTVLWPQNCRPATPRGCL